MDSDDDEWYHSLSKSIGLCALVLFLILVYFYAWSTYRRHKRDVETQQSIDEVLSTAASQVVDSRRPPPPPPIDNVLHPSVIALLPTFVYKVAHKLHTNIDTLECAVCLSNFEEGDMTKLIPTCKHMFHLQCINMWLSSHSTCPICRSSVQASIAEGTSDDASSQTTSKEHAYVITIDGRAATNR
ncbi:RING-H2 finger protein ATL39-like [Telopea speciosissima]|uniref:RING-H2 finger protein ATL39-like n=1 Tax=Telopea speciosissima TaxID=54955 RepID=UPI001CC49F4A|nr:RING-H2 finger protein ATL39-like [Telopea speciosissima]